MRFHSSYQFPPPLLGTPLDELTPTRRVTDHATQGLSTHRRSVEDTPSSDIDLLVDLDEHIGLVALAGLRRELRELLDAEVDVVPAVALKPALRQQVLAEAIPL